eukprot:CAMPEP_0114315994 /NCGR_PEP_ID=MMETSP0059-20121206/22932_1 /TAXON_ID=36894 /ORGANISM="Pyramimonas parkeae, Strain CCMP726" /LENGTH=420 /DNA_ID=CAMNT_0001441827 /DNA_START=202 /DNA_END=1465 /DNA_ORIENTATION=+
MISSENCESRSLVAFKHAQHALSTQVATRELSVQQLRRSMSALHLVDAAARELTESRARELAAAEHLLQIKDSLIARAVMLGMEIPRDLDDTNSDNSPSDSSDQNHTAKKLTAMPFGTEQARKIVQWIPSVLETSEKQRLEALAEAHAAEARLQFMENEIHRGDRLNRQLADATLAAIKDAERDARAMIREAQASAARAGGGVQAAHPGVRKWMEENQKKMRSLEACNAEAQAAMTRLTASARTQSAAEACTRRGPAEADAAQAAAPHSASQADRQEDLTRAGVDIQHLEGVVREQTNAADALKAEVASLRGKVELAETGSGKTRAALAAHVREAHEVHAALANHVARLEAANQSAARQLASARLSIQALQAEHVVLKKEVEATRASPANFADPSERLSEQELSSERRRDSSDPQMRLNF